MRLPLSSRQNTRQSERAGSKVPQWSVSQTEVVNQRDAHRHCDVSSGPQRSSERQPERFVWDVLNAVVGAPTKPTPGAKRDDDEVPAARYPIAAGGGEEPLRVRPAVRGGQGAVLGPRKVHIRAGVETEKCGANPGWRCDTILTGHGTACRENHD